MSSPAVRQSQALRAILKEELDRLRPKTVAMLGCAGGSGFDVVDPEVTQKVYGIDINPEYLERARERYADKIPGLELIRTDLNSDESPRFRVDFIYAGLIFEYLDLDIAFPRIVDSLFPGGKITTVIQRSRGSEFVTKTKFSSLEKLGALANEISFEDLSRRAEACDLKQEFTRTVILNEKKEFVVTGFKK